MLETVVSSPKKIEAEVSKKPHGLNGSDDLQQAADKITLMSPEVFEVKPKIKEEPRDSQDGQNLLTTPSRFVANLTFSS